MTFQQRSRRWFTYGDITRLMRAIDREMHKALFVDGIYFR